MVALLEKEIERNETRDQLIESLEFFQEPYAPDGVVGVEAKLTLVGRESSVKLALRYKEVFAKFLTRFSLYQAAQELIALCLHKILYEFESGIHPHCSTASIDDIDKLVAEKVVSPLLSDYASGVFSLNHGIVQGMVYWLADRCFVRWHAL
ncbi:MAG TPA: ABC-three component system protein [Allosphingosinicella sp.]